MASRLTARYRSARRRARPPEAAASSQLRNTVIAVLLTFLFSTVCGALLNLVLLENQIETKSAQDDSQQTLKAYDKFVSDVGPKFKESEKIGYEILRFSEKNSSDKTKEFAYKNLNRLTDTVNLNADGDISLYFGKEASMGLQILSNQYLAMRVMIDRRARNGTLKVDSDRIQEYLIGIVVAYKYNLLQILQCKRDASEKFYLWGKLRRVRACENQFSFHPNVDNKIWGPGVYDDPGNARLPYSAQTH